MTKIKRYDKIIFCIFTIHRFSKKEGSKLRKFIAIVAALALGTGMISIPATIAENGTTNTAADIGTDAETATSGYCGAEGNEKNVTWKFDDATGKLTIGGTGDMRNYDWSVNSPWKDHTVTGVVIGSGVTNIGDYAFYQCYDLISVSIPESVTHIGNWAFSYCDELEAVNIAGSVNEIGVAAFGSCGKLTSLTVPV